MKSNEKTTKRNISQVLLAGIAGSHALYFSVCSGKPLQTRGRVILPLFVLSTASKGKDFRDCFFTDVYTVSLCNPESRCFQLPLGNEKWMPFLFSFLSLFLHTEIFAQFKYTLCREYFNSELHFVFFFLCIDFQFSVDTVMLWHK